MLMGKTILGVYGIKNRKNQKQRIEMQYILFTDGKTIMEFGEQDMNYHDCDSSARTINFYEDRQTWKNIQSNTNFYGLSDQIIY